MKTATHTPAPHMVTVKAGKPVMIHEVSTGHLIAHVYGHSARDESGSAIPTATLYSAAPELLAALNAAHDKIIIDMHAEAQVRFGMDFDKANAAIKENPLVVQIRAAIAKATGA